METKNEMSDRERMELAAKLDRDLDQFIDGLEKQSYTDGWPEDRWEQEMEKHPFFMKTSPAPGEELSPLMVGLQELKFDLENNTPTDLALKYKEDGNYQFKLHNYRLAIINYTEGIKQHCGVNDLEATLYNNRAASQFFLKNYRSALRDCQAAFNRKPDYTKAKKRAAESAIEVQEFDLCVKLCDELLKEGKSNEIVLLRKNATALKNNKERNARKLLQKEKREKQLISELNSRLIKFYSTKLLCGNLKSVPKPIIEPLLSHPVQMNMNGALSWPLAFLFPENSTVDCMQSVYETTVFQECINELLAIPPEWDLANKYNPISCNIYYENRFLGKVRKLNKNLTLKQITLIDDFIIYDGSLAFYVVPANSEAENEFLNLPRIKAL